MKMRAEGADPAILNLDPESPRLPHVFGDKEGGIVFLPPCGGQSENITCGSDDILM
jgi:hypothetical protein